MELSVLVVTVGVLSGWVERPPSSFHDGDADVAAPLLDVVGEPAEPFAVALPLQHAAHEHLQWSRVQLVHGKGALGWGKHTGSFRTYTLLD